jgi:hypothetical protein
MGSSSQASRAYSVLQHLNVFECKFSISISKGAKILDYSTPQKIDPCIVHYPPTAVPESFYENAIHDKPSLNIAYSNVPVDYTEDQIHSVCVLTTLKITSLSDDSSS